MRIGVYSGSFDPIHTGHAMVANFVAQWGGVDEVWLMVSRLNPLKLGSHPAEDHQRIEMAELVASKCKDVKVSDFEMNLPLPSFTYFTLCNLREKYPEHDFVLIIGSDNWHFMDKWRDPEKIISEFGMIVYPRPGYDMPDNLPDNVKVLRDAPMALVSSTFIRHSVAKGKNVNYFVPCGVAEYIEKNQLYKS